MNNLITIVFVCFLLIYGSCMDRNETRTLKKNDTSQVITLKDDLGRTVKLSKKPTRVMGLTSSLTEMLFLLCDDSQIVGRTQNCDYPAAALSKPIVNNYPIDFEKLLMLKPDLVFAKDGIISLDDAKKMEEMGIPVYFQHYDHLQDIFDGVLELGKVLDRNERATFVADSLKRALSIVKSRDTLEYKPSVLIVINLSPLYVFGSDSYATDIIKAAGGVNAMTEKFNVPFPQITAEYLMKINPDIIVFLQEDLQTIKNNYPEFKSLKAFKNNKIFYLTGDLISRPGPRVVTTVEHLQKFIQKK